jgi:uncharacterized membrane protein YeaQ/YmgE (transglycosylase-associated protein family)
MVALAVFMPSLGRVTVWLFAGLAVGGTVRTLLGGGKGGVADAVLGLIGGLVGGFGALLTLGTQAGPWVGILSAVAGALVMLGTRDAQASPPSA